MASKAFTDMVNKEITVCQIVSSLYNDTLLAIILHQIHRQSFPSNSHYGNWKNETES
jgi:hypothetical protein